MGKNEKWRKNGLDFEENWRKNWQINQHKFTGKTGKKWKMGKIKKDGLDFEENSRKKDK